MFKNLPLAQVYQWLEPGPVVLLTTAHKGRSNVMTMSWHMMVEFEPPLIGCVVSGNDFSFAALRATKQAAIAIPAAHLAEKIVGVGNCSGREVDKFARFGLTALPAEKVQAPLVGECCINLECQVVETRLVNKFNLFILETVKAWRDPAQPDPKFLHHAGYGRFIVDGEVLQLKSKMP